MTLGEAITQAITDHGTDALWSDGADDWGLDYWRDEAWADDADSLEIEVAYDGRRISGIRADGLIGEPILSIVPVAPGTLAQLLDVINNAPEDAGADYAYRYGLPIAHGGIDMTALPTYGGDEPDDTTGVWSWDDDSLIVGAAAPYRLVPRG